MTSSVRDNVIYLSVALAMAGARAGYCFYHAGAGDIPPLPRSLLWGFFSTLVAVGLLLESFWKKRKQLRFWIGCLAVSAVDVAFCWLVFAVAPNIPLLVLSSLWAVCVAASLELMRLVLAKETRSVRK